MARVNLIFLHGFLGRPSDWEECLKEIGPLPADCKVITLDYLNTAGLGPASNFSVWASHLNHLVSHLEGEKNFLIGYSLGGRLGLQALRDRPSLWEKGIFVSTNPGLPRNAKEEIQQRLQQDHDWSLRFEKEDWSSLMKAWNSQGVLQSSSGYEPDRQEDDYSREDLKNILQRWSLGMQDDFRSWILSNAEKLEWIAGQQDKKFASLARELHELNPRLKTTLIENSGHRILFDQPRDLALKIKMAVNL